MVSVSGYRRRRWRSRANQCLLGHERSRQSAFVPLRVVVVGVVVPLHHTLTHSLSPHGNDSSLALHAGVFSSRRREGGRRRGGKATHLRTRCRQPRSGVRYADSRAP